MLGAAILLGAIAVALVPWRVVRRWRAARSALPGRSTDEHTLQITVTEPGQHPMRFASVGGAAAAKAALLRLSAPLRLLASEQELSDTRSGSYRSATSAVGGVLHGPPGCGKTLLARALAGELNLPLLAISAAELARLPGEAGAAPLRELFAAAVRRAPCLVLIDELDALPAAAGERAPSVSQLVCQLDGLSRQSARVVVLGTARRLDRVDETIVRPDRLGRAIAVGLPEPRERAEIIALLAREHPDLASLDVLALAARTDGYSAAALRDLLTCATQRAAERQRTDPTCPEAVEAADLEHALSALAARPPVAD